VGARGLVRGAKASKNKDEREIQKRSSNRCRLKCGFRGKGLQSEGIEARTGFRNRLRGKRRMRKGCAERRDGAGVLPVVHRGGM
jgi:hypothetical protein